MKSPAIHQRGFAAIAAIFLIVVLAALGGFMVTFSNTQQLTSALDFQGSRAYWAARAGLEWGVGSAGVACPTSPMSLTINGFTVVITCILQTYLEAGATVNIFSFTSVASSSAAVGDVGFVERSVSTSIER